MDLNLVTLDDLALEYLRTGGLLQGNGNDVTDKCRQCQHVRHLIDRGDLQQATALLKQLSPAILQDQRLLFRLLKQKFIECVRLQTAIGDQLAIACAREELAPLALDAFPEAYPEFKRLLLLLITRGRSGAAAAAGGGGGAAAAAKEEEEWDSTLRVELAGLVYQTACQALGLLDCTLSLLLRYLQQVHSSFQQATRHPAPAPQQQLLQLLQQLVPGSRDTAPLAPEHASAAGFSESQIQDVMQGAGVGRQAALDAMKRADGCAAAAFQQELLRMHVCCGGLDQLVWEYAVHRGLVGEEQQQTAAAAAPAAAEDMEVEEQEEEQQQQQGGHSPSACTGKRSKEEDRPPRHRSQRSNRTDSQSPPYKQPRFHPAAAAAAAADQAANGSSSDSSSSEECAQCQQASPQQRRSSARASLPATSIQSHQATLQSLQQLAQQQRWQELLEAAEKLLPGQQLQQQHVGLLFDLRRLQFQQLLASGDAAAALLLARQQLAPLAAAQPQLLPALKAAMAALLPGGFGAGSGADVAGSGAPPDAAKVVEQLLAVVRGAMGVQEPRLVSLLRDLLASHSAWFKLQRRQDPFAALLAIDRLTQPPAATPAATPKQQPPAAAAATAVPMQENSSSEEEEDAGPGAAAGAAAGGVVRESEILRLMEVLELPRSVAIELLEQNEGSVEAAVMQVLG